MSSLEQQTVERAMQAYRQATTGDFRASTQCLDGLEGDSSAVGRAWSHALLAQRWHADPAHGFLPSREAIETFVGEDSTVRVPAALACAEAARQAILFHRVDELKAWTELQQRLTDSSQSEWADALLKLHLGWLALAQDDAARADELAQQAGELASQNGIAPAVIEASVLRALCAEAADDIEEATSLARRASRMSRTEDLPQSQYLANLVLARMRRLSGLPHLTARILRPLRQAAPSQWGGWIAWEALMAGGLKLSEQIELADANDPAGVVRALHTLLVSAAQGNTSTFSASIATLESISAMWSSRKRDLDVMLVAIDARRNMDGAQGTLTSWCKGDVRSPPGLIKGLCIDIQSESSDLGPASFVVAVPSGGSHVKRPRRVAGLGEPLVNADARIARLQGSPERPLRTLAAIALAGTEGITRPDLFKKVYGFDYDEEVHRDLFKVLVYRARKLLGALGELKTKPESRFALEPNGTLVIPEPRCEQTLEDRVLRTLGRLGAQSAKETADQSGVPLRSTQKALKYLVDSGTLVVERVRNDVTYRVEDTTFSEPTKWS